MTTRVLELLLANVLMLVLGCGLLPFLRLARTRRELLTRAPLGYAVGLAATGILGADLAVAYVPLGRVLLPVLAAVSLFLGLRRVPGEGRPRRQSISGLPALAVLAATLFVAVPMARLLAVKPLAERDGWEIWAARARALYEFGHPAAPVFTDPIYPALQHPLLLPGLEAIDFRFMGAFDGTLVHLQLFGLAVGFVGGAWTLLRGTTRPILLAATLLALIATPTFVNQLQTNYADIPLAMFIALGVAALASWLRTGRRGDASRSGALPRRRRAHEERGRDVRADGDPCGTHRGPRRPAPAAPARRGRCLPRRPAVADLDPGRAREDLRLLALESLRSPVSRRPRRSCGAERARAAPSDPVDGKLELSVRAGARGACRRGDPWAVSCRRLRRRLARALVRGADGDLLDLDPHPVRQPLQLVRPNDRQPGSDRGTARSRVCSSRNASPRAQSVCSARDPGSVRGGADAASGRRGGARRGRCRAVRGVPRRGRGRRDPRSAGRPARGSC